MADEVQVQGDNDLRPRRRLTLTVAGEARAKFYARELEEFGEKDGYIEDWKAALGRGDDPIVFDNFDTEDAKRLCYALADLGLPRQANEVASWAWQPEYHAKLEEAARCEREAEEMGPYFREEAA